LSVSASAEVRDWLAGGSERVIETSCAWVFLEGARALKLKKPVDHGFLDFSTREKRRWALERELAFNRQTAPDIYRGVRRVTRGPGGGLELDGAGEVVDFALEMRAFDPADVLAERPERVDGALGEALGRRIAQFHAAAEIRPNGGGVWALGYTIRTNAEHLKALAAKLGAGAVGRVIAGVDAALEAAAPPLDERAVTGFARRCHGDLHLGNILLEEGRPVLFDCIEFNDRLSDIDVQYDVAFLLMDLLFRGRAEPANRVLNGWPDEAARAFPDALWDGLAALPLMLSARASVRAHVTANQAGTGPARDYLAAAEQHLGPPPPRLVAIGGLSGAGKTTLAHRLAPTLGAAPGAVVLRSDEIRKRLAGVHPADRLEASAYRPEMDARVYDEMQRIAARLLNAGRAVVLDAVFFDEARRNAARAIAHAAQAPFRGLWLAGPPDLLRRRIAGRHGDASDAGLAVLEAQLEADPGVIDWKVVAAADPSAAASGFDKD
jgi:aminoglycoside phosphotransferase family enzyme/predicted kinase